MNLRVTSTQLCYVHLQQQSGSRKQGRNRDWEKPKINPKSEKSQNNPGLQFQTLATRGLSSHKELCSGAIKTQSISGCCYIQMFVVKVQMQGEFSKPGQIMRSFSFKYVSSVRTGIRANLRENDRRVGGQDSGDAEKINR